MKIKAFAIIASIFTHAVMFLSFSMWYSGYNNKAIQSSVIVELVEMEPVEEIIIQPKEFIPVPQKNIVEDKKTISKVIINKTKKIISDTPQNEQLQPNLINLDIPPSPYDTPFTIIQCSQDCYNTSKNSLEGSGSGNGISKGNTFQQDQNNQQDELKICKTALKTIENYLRQKLKYPSFASQMGITGTVRIEIKISNSGTVDKMKIISSTGFDILDKNAIEYLKKIKNLPLCKRLLKIPIVYKLIY